MNCAYQIGLQTIAQIFLGQDRQIGPVATLPCVVLLFIVYGPESSFADRLILSLPGQKHALGMHSLFQTYFFYVLIYSFIRLKEFSMIGEGKGGQYFWWIDRVCVFLKLSSNQQNRDRLIDRD